MSGYEAQVLADSTNQWGQRLLTVQITFPRFILAELNTHRVFSRNSASSRAIPPEKQIARIESHPFVPEVFHARVKGMGQGEKIEDQDLAKQFWMLACEDAIVAAENLMKLGISKAHVNRILEPFMWHTAIVTATDWDNFFALRCPPGNEVDYSFPAQPEFQQIALCMRQVMRESIPSELEFGAWHLPLVHPSEPVGAAPRDKNFWPMVSAGRCARVSFDTHGFEEDPSDSYGRAAKLLQNGHLSPMEHPATPGEGRYQNLRNWKSLRHQMPMQANLIGHLDERGSWEDE